MFQSAFVAYRNNGKHPPQLKPILTLRSFRCLTMSHLATPDGLSDLFSSPILRV
jgi:hypothetical protein